MSDTVIIASVIALAVIIVAFIFRGSMLKSFKLKAGKEGLNAEIETHEKPIQEISGNTLKGTKNIMQVGRSDAHVRNNLLNGEEQKLKVK